MNKFDLSAFGFGQIVDKDVIRYTPDGDASLLVALKVVTHPDSNHKITLRLQGDTVEHFNTQLEQLPVSVRFSGFMTSNEQWLLPETTNLGIIVQQITISPVFKTGHISVMGCARLVRDPENRSLEHQGNFVSLNLAVNRTNVADFYNASIFQKRLTEQVIASCKKGNTVNVFGDVSFFKKGDQLRSALKLNNVFVADSLSS